MRTTQTDIEKNHAARRRIIGCLAACAAALVLLVPTAAADAALYQARQCNANGTEAYWGTNGDSQRYSSENTCGTGSGNRWLRTLTKTNGLTTANLTYGRWRIDAPPGTVFASVGGSWYHSLRNNFTHRLVFASGSTEREIKKATNAVQPSPGSFSDTSSGWTRFESQMFCSAGGSNRCAQDPQSWVAVSGLTFTLSDADPPAIGVGGSLTTGGAKSGVQNLNYYGQDSGSGMRQSRMYLDGEFTAVADHPCNEGNFGGVVQATTLRPCTTNGVGGSFSVDTRLLADGAHSVQYCAMDFAGFASGQLSRCSDVISFVVDSTPPAAPQNLRVAGGEDWHADNDFDAAWEIPGQGSGSQVTAVRYRVLASGYDSGVQTIAGPATSLQNLTVPGKGTYELRVWFRDEGGNESEASAAKATLRLDDARPGLARPHPSMGWLSRAELEAGYGQAWDRPNPLPLSGIRGYAVRIDQSQDGEPCDAVDRCRPEELYLVGDSDEGRLRVIDDLPEGTNYFHSAAVSNSLLKSSPTGTVPLKVDKTPPGIELLGAPAGWTNRDVGLDARAVDRLSGMAPAAGDDGQPVTSLQVDDDETSRSGDRAQETISEEGIHTVTYRARDLAGNESGVGQATVRVDKTAPEAPLELKLLGEEDWRADGSDFDLRWKLPEADQGSPISSARYRVRRVGGGFDSGPQVANGGTTATDDVTVPSPGEYEVSVWLVDEAGNGSEDNAATVSLQFDSARPGPVLPNPPSGWISRNELAAGHEQTWNAVNPSLVPASGIRGYATRVDQQPATEPCDAADRCSASEIDQPGEENRIRTIEDLPEGNSYFHVVAVSGALLKSAETRHQVLRVDKTDPGVTIAGATEDWTSRPVALVATSADSVSGMATQSGDDGQPFTAIRVGASEPVMTSGGRLEHTLEAEGAQTIAYWARDLAGNEAAPRQVTVRIDRTAPEVSFAPTQDQADPDLIRARTVDALSGVVGGQIAYRRAGAAQFENLPTQKVGDDLIARVDSDRLQEGAYEFRAEAVDAAGNRAVSDRRSDGSAMVLQLPLKLRTALSARFAPSPAASPRKPRCKQRSRVKRRRCRRRARRALRPVAQAANVRVVPYGIGVRVEGVLRTTSGQPVAGQPLTVTAEPDAGSASGPSSVGGSTGSDGGFTVYLPPGPSRTIRVSFGGSQTLARSSSEPLRLLAPSRASLRITPRRIRNRQRILIRGTVAHAGARIPVRGKLVEIQFYDSRRRRWRSVQLLRTDSAGRFEYPYRFLYIDRPSRIRFRGVAVSEAGWPFLASASRSVSVRVFP
jgi:hypothetical protein